MHARVHTARGTATAVGIAMLLAAGSAAADVIFNIGHQQVGHGINMDAATGATELTGRVQTQDVKVFFNDAQDAGGAVLLHASNGVSKLEACGPCTPPSGYTDIPWRSIRVVVESGYGFSDMDWALTLWDRSDSGQVTFTAYDQFGAATSQSFDVDPSNGKDKWHFHTLQGQLVTRMDISADVDLHHLEQMSANSARVVPEPASLALFGLGLLGLGALRKRIDGVRPA